LEVKNRKSTSWKSESEIILNGSVHERRPTVNRIDSKDEFFTEKREKEAERASTAKLNIFAPLVNGHFHYFGCF